MRLGVFDVQKWKKNHDIGILSVHLPGLSLGDL